MSGFDAIRDTLRQPSATTDDLIAALTTVPGLRQELDELEAALIDRVRASGVSWHDIATALGLRSRQAAEQRRLRLAPARVNRDPTEARRHRRDQQAADAAAGERAILLREAVKHLVEWLDQDDRASRPALRLARRTLRIALDAPPGALVDLARLALTDLTGEVDDSQPAVRRARGLTAAIDHPQA
jgi:DNA-binding transcriptional MerR regulator